MLPIAVQILDRWRLYWQLSEEVRHEDSASKDLYMQAQAMRDKCSELRQS